MELKVHAHLAIKVLEEPTIALWYYCRGLDANGSGKAYLTRQTIQTEFGISRSTVWRWLNNKKLFRHYRYDSQTQTYVVYMQSLVNVCMALKVKSLGGIGETDTVKDLAAQAALIEAQKLQAQSLWLAKRSGEGWSTVQPEDYFDSEGNPLFDISASSKIGRHIKFKAVSKFGNRQIMLLKKTIQTYGASQKGVADRLDVSVSTVHKLLDSASKFQPAVQVSWRYFFRARFEAEENLGSPLETGFFIKDGGPLKLLPYRYYPLYVLRSCKRLRHRLNRALNP